MKRFALYKGELSIYLILVICIVALMLSLKKCSNPLDNEVYYERAGGDTINVAIEISPLSMSLSTDSIGGFYYDILNLISNKYNVNFKYHEFVPLSFAFNGLESGNFDIVVADIPATSELKEKYLLTEPLYIDHQILVQRKDKKTGKGNITDYTQLTSDSIWVVAGSPYINRIRNLSDELGCDEIYIIESPNFSSEQLIILTALGEVKQSVVNANIAKSMIKDYPQLDINTKISFNQFQVWALKHSNVKLCDKFNHWIKEVKKLPEYDDLCKRYLKIKK